MSKVAAIATADIHLSLKPPIARSSEPDWLEAQDRVLAEIRWLQRKHNCQVIIAGDLFDKWNSPPEIINFALDKIPKGSIAISGNHETPLHNVKNLPRVLTGH